MSQAPYADIINLQDFVRLLYFSILFRWPAWLYINNKNTVCCSTFTACNTQT